jgi:hypothetical protein
MVTPPTSLVRVSMWPIAVWALVLFAGCSRIQQAPEPPLPQATVTELMAQLRERETTIQTIKGLFRAQLTGPVLPFAQRVDGAVFYRRPETLRLRGFTPLGGMVFEFGQNQMQYWLELPSEGRRVGGSLEDLRNGKIGRLVQLARWAVRSVVGESLAESTLRLTLVEDGRHYRLDVQQAAPSDRLLRRLWFDRRSLHVVQDERFQDTGEVEATMTFEDYRALPLATPQEGEATAQTTWMPFKVTVTDHVTGSSLVLTFHELIVNGVLRPEELGLTGPGRTG